MKFVNWIGRVLLWTIFLPVGLWRSIRHGQRKRDDRNQAAYREVLAENRAATYRQQNPDDLFPPPPAGF